MQVQLQKQNKTLVIAAIAATLTISLIGVPVAQKALAYYQVEARCGNPSQGQIYYQGHYWYYDSWCLWQYDKQGGNLYYQYQDIHWWYWNGASWVDTGWTGWKLTYDRFTCPSCQPILLWKVGETKLLIRTNYYNGDAVAANCKITSDIKDTLQLSCHELTKLPAGTNSTNPQHLQNNTTSDIKPIFGGPLITWGPGFTTAP